MKRFELERAISENELVLHYQPMVEVPSRRLTGVERAQLADTGFAGAQGFLIAAPVPEARLSERRAARV